LEKQGAELRRGTQNYSILSVGRREGQPGHDYLEKGGKKKRKVSFRKVRQGGTAWRKDIVARVLGKKGRETGNPKGENRKDGFLSVKSLP